MTINLIYYGCQYYIYIYNKNYFMCKQIAFVITPVYNFVWIEIIILLCFCV